MVSPVTGSSGSVLDNTQPAAKTNNPADLANKDTFLQLLVAQIKNQNPLSPTDGVQFLSQLAQFTQVEQSSQMRDDLSQIRDLLKQQAAAPVTADPNQTPATTAAK